MPFKTEIKEGKGIITVEHSLSVYDVVELRRAIVEYIESAVGVRIDLKGVDECDAAGVQLLYSAQKTAKTENKDIRILGISPALRRIFEKAGVDLEYFENHIEGGDNGKDNHDS